jgi:CDP-diacylglycerol--glycerol-3-phosphate 3-phosphatidyltransferase
MIAAAFASDVYDGVLARRWGTVTAALRTADSATDVLFYLCVLGAAVARHWPELRVRIGWIVAVLALEAIHVALDSIKYGRVASYHAWSAKIWGVLLAAAAIALLCFDRGFWILTIALAWGILCELEGLAMTALLPQWSHDVKTLRRAWVLRREMQKPQPVLAGRD